MGPMEVEDHVPHRCHRHQRGNVGEERHGAEVAQLHVLVQQHSHGHEQASVSGTVPMT